GFNILGTQETVSNFKRDDFLSFVRSHLDNNRLVLSIVGNIPFSKALRIARKYLDHIPAYNAQSARKPVEKYIPQTIEKHRSILQAHCAMGATAYPLNHEKRLKFFTLINILGGPGMNSRLNLALREKHGYVYAVDASYHGYTDTGIFGIYFATDPSQLNRSIRLVEKELKKLREVPLGRIQLHTAKQQLKGQLAMAEENNGGLMLMMAKSILDLERIEPIEKIFEDIKAIKASELQEIANEIFEPARLSRLIFLPD
ncbi:MAG: pitrilysin family protein, partial [Cyclobacteriaceae bacterium]